MSKVTSKLQVTIPKTVARSYRIKPGSEVMFEPAGEVIRLRTVKESDNTQGKLDEVAWKLQLFDAATSRQAERDRRLVAGTSGSPAAGNRGWRREDLYTRGVSR